MTQATQKQSTTKTRSKLPPEIPESGRSETTSVIPERRDLHFLPPADRISNWHGKGAHLTQFLNALSLFFPAGERMFIDAVRSYRDQIPDPDLKKAATAFIGQEAMHSREHVEYNRLMEDAGMPAEKLEGFIWSLLDWIKTNTPKAFPLSGTIALEHYTALMGASILDHPETMEGSEEHYQRMWFWHAMEEIEHKAVAYDVYEKTIGRGPRAYALRATGMVVASAIFWPILLSYYIQMTNASEECRREGWRGHFKVLNTLFGRPGIFRKQVPELLEYFKYSFHPWQQDNSHHLAELEELAETAEAAYATATRH